MYKLAFVFLIILLIISNPLIAEESNDFSLLTTLMVGLTKVNHDEINSQLDKYYDFEQVEYSVPLGIEGLILYKNTLLFGPSVMVSRNVINSMDESGLQSNDKMTFYNTTIGLKVGYSLLSQGNDYLYPSLGIGADYLNIDSEIQAGIRTPGVFFGPNNTYSKLNWVLMFGVSYMKSIRLSENSSTEFVVGLNIGGITPISSGCWSIDGEGDYCPDESENIPEFNSDRLYISLSLGFLWFK